MAASGYYTIESSAAVGKRGFALISELYIRSVLFESAKEAKGSYPFSLPAFRGRDRIDFHENVTFFVGENGTGKSTLLEAVAVNDGFNPEGGTRNYCFSTQDTHSELSGHILLAKGSAAEDGYFLRAESFYNAASYLDELDRQPAASPKLVDSYGGRSLHRQSHGENFMALVTHRFSGGGIYILDEPEAALSPAKQFALLARIHALAGLNAQFIIATHSPILLGLPGAEIYQLSEKGMEPVRCEETEHYRLTARFLNDREKMLAIILGGNA